MRSFLIVTLSAWLFLACSKSSSTSYSLPPAPPTAKRLIKFGYEGQIFGVFPVYQGLADTPKHTFEATGITESDFVKTKAGDTILITIALCSDGTKPIVTAVEDNTDRKPVSQTATEIETPDASAKFRIIVK